ncbi:hypothetical protein EPI10_019231 [Gossypium australe]|uniref:Uncharacterized protein n=1 Tax=Gossypium australe TaxID=47621 RepID=A0A5B6UHG7_9ROSI|nr:hypothetical protein EPI10_019231 [Gossypium australe]
METFYIGLNDHTRIMVDASTNRALLSKSYNEAYEIIERIYHSNFPWSNQWAGPTNISMPSQLNYLPEYSQQVQQPPLTKSSGNLKDLLKAYIAKNDVVIQSQATMLKNLGNQADPKELCPDTKNPRISGKEHCKTVTLPSGKTLEPKVVEVEDEPIVTQYKEEVQLSVKNPVS